MSELQRLYGLTVHSDRPLHQDRPAPPGSAVDLHVSTGEPVDLCDANAGGVPLLAFDQDGRRLYSAVRLPDDSLVLQFNGACEFRITPSLAEVVVHPVRGADPGLAAVLTTGALLAFQLYLRSHAVLHASAVDIGGRAVAFVGHSGMGKSTLAAIMCAAGANIVTDDVLRLDFAAGSDRAERPTVRLGATELRLRKGAESLVERFEGASPGRRTSADAREVLRLGGGAQDSLPLAGVVIPRPNRDLTRTALRRIDGKKALFALLSFPRLAGWLDPDVLDCQLAHLSRIAGAVPIFVADVPWGPPFPMSIAADVVAAMEA